MQTSGKFTTQDARSWPVSQPIATSAPTWEIVRARLPECPYEHIFIDNDSSDSTVAILKDLARQDRNVKIIVNSRNFGHLRSHRSEERRVGKEGRYRGSQGN